MSSLILLKNHHLYDIPKNGIVFAQEQKWRVRLTQSAQKQLKRLPTTVRYLADEAVIDLAKFGHMPKNWNIKKIDDKTYRIKLNYRYRLKYTVKNTSLLVEIFYIGHRKDAY